MKSIKLLFVLSFFTSLSALAAGDYVCSCDGGPGWFYGHKESITQYVSSATAAGIFEMKHSGHSGVGCHINGTEPGDVDPTDSQTSDSQTSDSSSTPSEGAQTDPAEDDSSSE